MTAITELTLDSSADDTILLSKTADCHTLQRLKVRGCKKITDAALVEIAKNNPDLKNIDLCDCVKISDVTVSALTKYCPNLRSLNLSWTQITNDAVVAIRKELVKLRVLKMASCLGVTDASLVARRGSKLEKLHLGMLKVGKAQVSKIITLCKRLKQLDLVGQNFETETYVDIVRRSKALRTLICSCEVEEDKKLQKKLLKINPQLVIA